MQSKHSNKTQVAGPSSFSINVRVGGYTKKIKFDVVTLSKEIIHTHVKVSPYNPRNQQFLTPDSVEALRKDIEEHGQIKPVWGHQKEGLYYILDGSCRLKVSIILDRPLIAFITSNDVSEDELKHIAHSLSKSKALSLMERGALYQEWLDTGFFKKASHIAQAESVSGTLVSSALQAHNLKFEFKSCFIDPVTLGRPAIVKLTSLQKKIEKLQTADQMRFYQKLTTTIDCEEIQHDMEMALYEQAKLKNKKAQFGKKRVIQSTLNAHIIKLIVHLYEEEYGVIRKPEVIPASLVSVDGISGVSKFSEGSQIFRTKNLTKQSFDYVNETMNMAIAAQSQGVLGGGDKRIEINESDLNPELLKRYQDYVSRSQEAYFTYMKMKQNGLLDNVSNEDDFIEKEEDKAKQK